MVERFERRYATTHTPAQTAAEVDAGLRAYMLRIYNYMTGGVLLTGIMAMLTYRVPALQDLLFNIVQTPNGPALAGMTGLGWIVTFAPLGFVLVMSFGLSRLSASAAQGLFWAFSAVMGLSLSSIFFTYTGVSIARTFFVTAATFGALSLYGYTTKKRSDSHGQVPVHGPDRPFDRHGGQYFRRFVHDGFRHLRHRRADFRGPYRL